MRGVDHAMFKGWGVRTEIDMSLVMAHIREQARKFKVTGVAYDPQYMHHAGADP